MASLNDFGRRSAKASDEAGAANRIPRHAYADSITGSRKSKPFHHGSRIPNTPINARCISIACRRIRDREPAASCFR